MSSLALVTLFKAKKVPRADSVICPENGGGGCKMLRLSEGRVLIFSLTLSPYFLFLFSNRRESRRCFRSRESCSHKVNNLMSLIGARSLRLHFSHETGLFFSSFLIWGERFLLHRSHEMRLPKHACTTARVLRNKNECVSATCLGWRIQRAREAVG